jgi:thiamine-phosphate diphosphorylase
LHLVGPLGGATKPDEYVERVEAAVRAGLMAVHVRMPGATGGDVLTLANALMDRCTESGCMVIVNDRVDVAALTAAQGIHLGERSLPVTAARSLVGPECLIGRSIHDVDGALRAEQDGADYLMAGHVFETASKPDQPGRGLHWLADVCNSVRLPVIAIGGINADRVAEVVAQGAWGIAVGREILDAPDPGSATTDLLQVLERK